MNNNTFRNNNTFANDNTLGAGVDSPQVNVRCAIYTRFSSDMQRPASLEDQERNCRTAAGKLGWTVLDDFVRGDRAASGTTLFGRDGLRSLIEAAKRQPRLAAPDKEDRGLLFVCYQASIENQFQKLVTDWVNAEDAPKNPSGFDPLISTAVNRRFLAKRQDGTTLTVPLPGPAVVATGSAFLFVPPISALKGILTA